ncbi:hypothetical protein [Aeromicrobium sp. PE09-221]|uniref:hypothetical protein n=1 Tax=Aeromicrobium sp. PE09-221 TaxID=1898043 RepID=UPI00111D67F7|nr:hypothetical protein [Aeromicrobium sp. PE09-221]
MSEAEAGVWRPISARRSALRAEELASVVEGFPTWLAPSVREWLGSASHGLDAQKAERVLRVVLPHYAGAYASRFVDYWDEVDDDDDRIDLVDFVLRECEIEFRGGWGAAARSGAENIPFWLENILAEGGSAWRVVETPYWGLERRVSEETRGLVESAASGETDAARAIRGAWNACYSPSPDYSKAYGEAVKAVEACVLPLTIPKDAGATLGKAIGHVRDTVSVWSVGGLGGKSRAPGETLLAMLETLWQGQERHATPEGAIRDVAQSEAEAAVSLAVTLVHWFTSGLVSRP